MQQGAAEATKENQLVVGVGRINGISGSDFDPPSLSSVGLQGRADGFFPRGRKKGRPTKTCRKGQLAVVPFLSRSAGLVCMHGWGGEYGCREGPLFL